MDSRLAGSRPAHLLLVEDNESDVILTREAFRRARLMVDLHHVEDGEQCMAFLRGEAPYAGAPRPDLVLLDLNMPRMDGHEVLRALEADPRLRELAVAVLVPSEADRHLLGGYGLPRLTWMAKPVDFAQLQRVAKALPDCWLTLVVLPGAGS